MERTAHGGSPRLRTGGRGRGRERLQAPRNTSAGHREGRGPQELAAHPHTGCSPLNLEPGATPPTSRGRGSRCTFNARHVSGAGAVAASGFLQKPPTPRLARAGARIQSPARPLTAVIPYLTNGAPPLLLSPAPDLRLRPISWFPAPRRPTPCHAEPYFYWFRILPIINSHPMPESALQALSISCTGSNPCHSELLLGSAQFRSAHSSAPLWLTILPPVYEAPPLTPSSTSRTPPPVHNALSLPARILVKQNPAPLD